MTSSFEDAERFALEQNARGYNVYHTVNPIIPTFSGKNAGDDDIARLRWIPYDIDPLRHDAEGQALKGKQSASNAEKAAAKKVADAILAFYRGRNLDPALVDSGNGYLVLVPADLTPDNAVVVKQLLEVHAKFFDVAGAHIDVSVSNPSRILAVPGTLKRKGENTAERPWREVRLLHAGTREKVLDEQGLRATITR